MKGNVLCKMSNNAVNSVFTKKKKKNYSPPGHTSAMKNALNTTSLKKIILFSCYCVSGLRHLEFAMSV